MAENEGSASGPNAMLIAIIVAILMLGGGFALSYYVLPQRLAEELVKASRLAEGDETAAPAKEAHSGGGHGGGKKGEGSKSVEEFAITDLLVNVKDSGGARFVKATVFFEAEQPVLNDLESKRPKITDIVAQTLGSKTIQELNSADSRGKLRLELMATINPLLDSKGEVKNIYFPELIIQ
jgi:flagellar protein FliL